MRPINATGGDVIAKMLSRADVAVIFGVLSIHNMPIYDALARHGGFRLVKARTEAGAVNMADAYSRVGDRVGVAVTSTGTGAGNAAGAMVEADTAGSQVLHLTGQVPTSCVDQGRGYIHEARNQLQMLEALSPLARRVRRPQELAPVVADALWRLGRPLGGPVSIEIPIDIQEGPAPCLPDLVSSVAPGGRAQTGAEPDGSALDAVAEALRVSRRPLVWAGGGARRGGAASAVAALADRVGAGVITSAAGRGIVPETLPCCLGNFGSSGPVQELLDEADLLVVIGCRLRANETRGWRVSFPDLVVQIDADPGAIGRNCEPSLALVGPARTVVEGLLARLGDHSADPTARGQWSRRIVDAKVSSVQELEDTLVPYHEIPGILRTRLGRDVPIVRDVTISTSTWGNRLPPVLTPFTSVHAVGGGIGQGLAMAVGAACARPGTEVFHLCGDGGLVANIGELATAVEERLEIKSVVFNDGGYGVLRNIQRADYGGRIVAADLQAPDFVVLAGAFGAWATRVTKIADFASAFDAARAVPGPAFVEVDMTEIGDFAVPFGGPARQ